MSFLFLAPCGWSGVWHPGPFFGGPALWCAVVPWGSPLACSPQPWAETRWRRVRLSRLLAVMGVPLGPGGCRYPANRRLFRRRCKIYITEALGNSLAQHVLIVIPPRPTHAINVVQSSSLYVMIFFFYYKPLHGRGFGRRTYRLQCIVSTLACIQTRVEAYWNHSSKQ